MAISVKGSYTNKSGIPSTTTISVTTSGVAVGDVLIGIVSKDGTGAITGPSGWTSEGSATNSCVVGFWSKEAVAGDVGAVQYTWSGASEKWLASIIVLSGADYSTISTLATGTGSSTSPTCPTVTPASADSIVIAGFTVDNAGVTAIDAALTTIYVDNTSGGQGNAGQGAGYEIHDNTATGTYIGTSGSNSWAAGTLYIEEIDTSINVITPGVYTHTGTDVDALKTKIAALTPGTYTYSGIDVSITKGYLASPIPGVYTYTGIDISALKTKIAALIPGSYVHTGIDINAVKGRTVVLTPGAYTHTGSDITITSSKTYLDPGVYTHNGSDVTIFKKGQPSFYINMPDNYLGYNVEL